MLRAAVASLPLADGHAEGADSLPRLDGHDSGVLLLSRNDDGQRVRVDGVDAGAVDWLQSGCPHLRVDH